MNPHYRSPEFKAAAVAAYAAGEASESIAKRIGASATSVTNWCRDAGVPIRSRGGKPDADADAYIYGWVRDGLVWRPVKPGRRRAA